MTTMYDARPESEPHELDLDELAEVTTQGILDRFWEFADEPEEDNAFLGYFMLTDPLHAKQLELICEELGLRRHWHEHILIPTVPTESLVFVETASNMHDGMPCDVTLQLIRSTDQVDLA